jgi:AcrR family transcriptional regulator
MPQTPKHQDDPLREALVDLCFERGFRNCSLEDLLDRAGISRAEFERRYSDFEDCFYDFWEAEVQRFETRAAQAREGLTSWRERVRATAYAMYRYFAEDEKLTTVTISEMRTAGERVLVRFGQASQALFELIDEGRQELADPSSLTIATAETVGGGVFNQIYLLAAREAPFPPEEEIVPPLLYAVVLPYLGAAAAQEELTIPPPP